MKRNNVNTDKVRPPTKGVLARWREKRIKERAKRKAKLSPLQSGQAGYLTRSRAERHVGLDVIALRKRRARNRVARRQRRVNRQRAK